MRTRLAVALAAIAIPAVVPASAGATAGEPVEVVSTHLVDFTVGSPGPLGSVTFLGDSVGIGAGRWAPTLPDQLIARGWGPVRFHAVDGGRTGYPPGWPDYFNMVPLIDQYQAAGWDSDTWIVNLGANDSGYCSADVQCAKNAIMLVVDSIGPGHRIWWPKITRFALLRYQADAWNAALDQVAAERADFWTWDWPSEMWAHPDIYQSWDGTHLYPDGYRHRSAVMAQAFTDAVARAVRVGGDAPLGVPASGPLAVATLAPTRLVDTRDQAGGRLDAGEVLTVPVGTTAPTGALGVVVNLTAVAPAAAGHLTAYACDDGVPATSNLNYGAGRTRAASAFVLLSDDRTICVRTHAATDVVVDLQAALVPTATPGAVRLEPLSTPQRLADTRATARTTALTVAIPAGSAAAVLNLTVTGAAAPGHLTAYPCGGDVPLVSNVNFGPGDTIAGGAIVPVGDGGAVCVATSTSADVIVDLTATLRSAGGLVFVPIAPTRALDTRDATGGWSPIHGAGQTLDVGVAPTAAAAVTGTVTLVAPSTSDHLVVAPCGSTGVATSTVNSAPGDVVANITTVGIAGGRACITSVAATHTVFDVTGWWVPG